MERVIDVYHETYDETHPLICMDEASKQVIADVEPALPMSPGQPRREDHHYCRKDVRALFLFFDPVLGWRRVSNRESRKRADWAEEIKTLLDEDYPDADQVTLICDNLNTHDIASLYWRYPSAEAHRLEEDRAREGRGHAHRARAQGHRRRRSPHGSAPRTLAHKQR